MAESLFIDVAKSLGLRLASYAKEQLLLAWGLDSEVKRLKSTIDTINAFLKDAQERPGGITSHTKQNWLTELRNAVYAADDVFDEIVTRADRKKLMGGNAFEKEVKLFCSSSNQLVTSVSLAQRVKSIRESLDESYNAWQKFGDTTNCPIEGIVQEEKNLSDNMVGREQEKSKIISMLNSSYKENVCVIPILGEGGLGKSTLARHVFDDEQVKENFKDLHLWVPLPQDVEFKGVMEKIVDATGENLSKDCKLAELKFRLSGLVNGKKYLLVLDNVWNEDVTEWRDLQWVLTHGAAHGSRIISTTRSPIIARQMATVGSFVLKPLDRRDSWTLFESIVFGEEGCQNFELKKVGSEILSLCHNVPLAIQALARVLATNVGVSSWSRFQNDTALNLPLHDKSCHIMRILEQSYHYLSPSILKSCFSYCSLLPKGHEFDKNKLVILWMTQGFIEPLHEGGTLEEQVAEYLEKLLNKGLLQHVPSDESHTKCKLHDLMHDVACSVAAEQCQMLKSRDNSNVKGGIYHISIGYDVSRYKPLEISSSLRSIEKLRTFLLAVSPTGGTFTSRLLCQNLMTSLHCLRVLDLHNLGINELPKSLGKLIHLRYLDLSGNHFKRLPKSITQLHNLQYLDLSFCYKIIKMPKDMKKLVNLRHFLLGEYTNIQYIPLGLEKLTNLQTLDTFVIGNEQDQSFRCLAANKSSKHSHLSELKPLDNLRGELWIHVKGSYQNMGSDAGKANLKAKTNLKCLHLVWYRCHYYEDEIMLENLQPHNEISKLHIYGYGGEKLPTWMATSSLRHLEAVGIYNCQEIKCIPSFSQLPNLKYLRLVNLPGVEHLGSNADEYGGSSALLSSPTIAFPSLVEIDIQSLPCLKGWTEFGVGDLLFPRVSKVTIIGCDRLQSFPSCPNVEELKIKGVENVQLLKEGGISSSSSPPVPKLKRLTVHSVEYLASLPRECLLEVFQLEFDPLGNQPLDVSELEKGLTRMTSLKFLLFSGCCGLTSFSGLPVQLNTLERLEIRWSYNIPFLRDGDQSEQAWQALQSLRFLKFYSIGDLKVFPQGIKHLTTLQSLELRECNQLEAMPCWIGNLCSLSRLEINNCCKLTSLPQEMTRLEQLKQLLVKDCPTLGPRCQRDRGEDWLKIQHVKEVITT